MPRHPVSTVLRRRCFALTGGLLMLALLGVSVLPAAAAAPPTFAAAASFAVDNSPWGVTTADLNGDDRADLVAANYESDTVSVLLNTTTPGAATPAFAAQATFATGYGPSSVAVADLNGDGKPDLAVANSSSNVVSVLLNTAAPGAAAPAFAAQVTFVTGDAPISVAAADLNGDGRPDLATANLSSGTVSVLLNTTAPGAATPAFAAQASFATGSSPRSVAADDLNGDGKPDLVAANDGSNTVSVLLNTTAPGAAVPAFAAQVSFATDSRPFSVAAADLNGDGRPDLATANLSSGTVSVLLNTTAPGAAAPAFADRAPFATGSLPASVAAADLNGDGKPDLAVANRNSDTVSVLLNTTAPGAVTPAFAARADFATGLTPLSVAAADLNGDDKPDLAVANYGGNTVSVLLNTTPMGAAPFTCTAATHLATGNNPDSVAVADLNGDGRPDLAVANWDNHTVSVLLNTTPSGAAAPAFAAQATFATGTWPSSAAAADLNGDGRVDLAVTNAGSNTVSVLLNTTPPGAAAPSFAAQAIFATGVGPYSVAAADLNGDGKPDLAVANRGGNTVSVLLNTTTPGAAAPAFAAQAPFATGSLPASVVAADLNGDGKPDLAVANQSSSTVSVLLNTTAPGAAAPSFAAQVSFATGTWPTSVVATDLNGDGKPDLVVANYSSNNVSVLLNITTPGAAVPAFAAQVPFATGNYPSAVAADLNSDGRPDLAVANYDSDTVSVLLNTAAPGAAAPAFAAQATFATDDGPHLQAATDLNGDGKIDLATANWFSNTVSVLLNTTTASLGLTKTVSPAIAYPGDAITYTLAFTNTNLFTAAEVGITDTLPASLTGVSVASNVLITDTGASPAYTWQVQDLAPGAGGVITITGVLSGPLVSGVFTNTAASAALGMEPRSAAAGVTVVVPGVLVAPASLTIPEPDGSGVLTLTLNSRPAATVTIPLSAGSGECSVPAAVELLPDQWQAGVPVTVQGLDDGPDGPQVCLVQFLPVVSEDLHYAGLDPEDVTVTVIDRYGVFLPVVLKVVP